MLYDYQIDAINHMHNGCILCGGVGSGKSRTALGYYFAENEGVITNDGYVPMVDPPQDLYIITTAKKRDSLEWEGDMCEFLISPDKNVDLYSHDVIIDSWNNIAKYKNVKGAFFIFDEQRVVGSGAWVKAFLKIARGNDWILLSATPGDKWEDYIPVFIANGFYKNRTEFIHEHIIYSRFSKYPKVDRYINIGRLIRLRNRVLVNMEYDKKTVTHHEDYYADYDIRKYKTIFKDRWNPFENKPIETASELCYALRKVVNSSEGRQLLVLELAERAKRAIIFYNFDYELDILKTIFGCKYCEACDGQRLDCGHSERCFTVAEWNGHKHQPIPKTPRWVYLVQYNAGAEGWSCIKTDTIIFYSQNYSYKTLVQASGRTDRLNTPYQDLYYYHLKSHAGIDLAIARALKNKKKFNEREFVS